MTPEEIKAVQAKSLEIFLYFKQFCEEHNLMFFVIGGCCIGAIRHKGFIPWDDDIDLFMLREDYEKLGDLWKKFADTSKYSYSRSNNVINIHQTTTKIQDNNTTFINSHSIKSDIHHGLCIDVGPIDGCPNSKIKRIQQMFFAMIFSLFNAQRLPDNQGKAVRIISKIILSIVRSPKLRYKIWSYAEKQMTKYKIEDYDYITELMTGLRYLKLKYPKEIFEKAVYKEFEGYQVPLPIGYEKYLQMAFGDYMVIPPESERVPKHTPVYVNLNESYEKYKGIYYCVDKGKS